MKYKLDEYVIKFSRFGNPEGVGPQCIIFSCKDWLCLFGVVGKAKQLMGDLLKSGKVSTYVNSCDIVILFYFTSLGGSTK